MQNSETEAMRDVLRRCNKLIECVAGVSDMRNIPMLVVKLKKLNQTMDLAKLVDDLKKYSDE